VQIGIDASGTFDLDPGFEPTTVAGAVVSDRASAEIAEWVSTTLRSTATGEPEIHMKELNWDERLAVCEMLARRADIRLSVSLTDQLLLGSADVVSEHRRRQIERIRSGSQPQTREGRDRFETVIGRLQAAGSRIASTCWE
jgi:hypothetical protein